MTRSRADVPNTTHQTRTLLLATDNKNSVLAEIVGGKLNPVAYSAYGQQSAQEDVATGLGFNGAPRERRIGWYLLGNGYRAYNPTLMRFHSPDSWSPFGGGGLNAYMYCVGDPVNFSDPTGHVFEWLKTANLFKTPNLFRRNTARTTSYTSLSPLTSNTTEVISNVNGTTVVGQSPTGISNPTFTGTGPIYEKLPKTPVGTPQKASPYPPIVPRSGNKIPPPIPPKQKKPYFNDTGGEVRFISHDREAPMPPDYRTWKREPFLQPFAPVPPTRTLPGGASRHYSVTYDFNGNPTQKSVEKISSSQIGIGIRNPKK